jgi:phenylalanyl-tRNA synthetase beta chain
MKILTSWLRELLPGIPADDAALAADLTLRGIAVDGVFSTSSQDGSAGSIFEMDITTNRVDAMNHYGVAREAALIYGLPLPPLSAHLSNVTNSDLFSVQVEEPQACGRFTARVLRAVTIRDSHPDVLDRFAALGVKAINNAVDASNYVLQQMGHPTHAFDLDKLAGGKIIVRLARAGEKLVMLDGVERTLSPDDLVIADAEKAISLAGILGGWATMITPATRNILIEAAWFDPDRIRRSARRHGIHSDASHRFERGADFAAPPLASALVCEIILRDGGTLHGELTDVRDEQAANQTENRPSISLHLSEVERMLGSTTDIAALTGQIVHPVLAGLGCGITQPQVSEYRVQLPSWRLDLSREIDLIEEIARVYGYNRFADTLPSFRGAVETLPGEAQDSALRQTLLGAGYNEATSSTFCSVTEGDLFAAQPGQVVAMGNPLSQEAGVLRPSLLPGMVQMLAHNLNNGADEVRLFEIGTVFSGSTDKVDERQSLAIGLTGGAVATALFSEDAAPFFALKGVVESLLARFDVSTSYFDAPVARDVPLQPAWLAAGRAARVVADGMTLGWLGQLASQYAESRKLRRPVYVCELSLERLFHAPLRSPVAQEISRYPAVERDFAFIFADALRWEQIAAAVAALSIQEMTNFSPREIFRDAKGAKVPAEHYSLLLRTKFQSAERTLTEAEVQTFSERIVAALTALGGVLRA